VVKRSPAHAARQREFLGWSAVSFRKLELTTYRLQPAYIGEFSSLARDQLLTPGNAQNLRAGPRPEPLCAITDARASGSR